jgi:hypothetical protein
MDFMLSAGFGSTSFSVALEGHAQLPSETRAARHDADVRASLLGGALVPCVRYARLAACAVTLVGAVAGTSDTALSDRQTTPFASVGVRAAYEHPLTISLALQAWTEGDVVLTPTTFLFQDGAVWRSSPLGARAGAALKAYFP